MGRFFGRHRVRATFYHLVAVVFLISTALWVVGIMSDKVSYIVTAVLFVADYIAEMYDPHPDNPGPWFRAHFHRMFDGDTEPVEENDYDRLLRERREAREVLIEKIL